MSSVLDGIASTLSYYTGYDFTGSAASSSSSSPQQQQPAIACTFPTLSHHGSAGTADYSGLAADPSTLSEDDDNITALYSSAPNDDEYFNLGGSSFPLLPHAPHMVDAFEGEGSDDDADDGRSISSASSSTSEQKQSLVSAARSSHHFSSVLNNPLASYDDFEEEDMLPFAPAYIPALTDAAIDAAQVRRHIAAIGNVDAYRDNHPDALHSIPAVSGHSSQEPLGSPTASHSPSLLTPFASSTLPRAFTFSRRRSSNSSSAAGTPSRSRPRRAVSLVSLQAAAAKARAEEEQIVARELADCLSTVPAPFFSASYELQQQPFFLELLTTISLPASASASQKQHTAASLALQSALSAHLDQVELSLFRAINARSHQFFSVMSRVEALKLEIAECVDSIQSVQVALQYVDEHLISGGLQVVEQHVRRSNVSTLCAKLELMQMCSRTQATVQLLLSTGDYGSSLMLIQQTRAVLSSELSGVTSMRNVERKLMEQVRLIEKLMESEMMSIVMQAEDADEGRREEKDGRERRRGEVQHIRRELTEDERERLSPILENLVKLGALPAAIADYRRELAACIKQRLTDLVYAHIDAVVNDELEDTGLQQQTAAPSPGSAVTASASAASPTSSSSSSPSSSSAASPTAASAAASSTSISHAHAPVSAAVSHTSAASEAAASLSDAAAPSQSPSAESAAHAPLPPPPPPSSSPLPSAPSTDSRSSSPTPGTAAYSTAPSAAPLALPISTAAPSLALAPTASTPAAATSSTITLRLQSLSHRQFMDFLSPLFSALMDPIYRAASVKTLLAAVLAALDRELDVTASVTPAASAAANTRQLASLSQRKTEYAASLPLLSELLVSSSELLHLRIAKLLSRRQALHAALPLPSFRELLETVLSFLQQSEALCGRQFYGLRGALLGQAKAFVAVFHAASIREMAETLDKEKWQRIDVDYQYQEIIDSGFVRQHRPAGEAEEESKMPGKGGSGQGSEEERKEARNGTHTAAKTERKVLFVPIPRSSSASGSSSLSAGASTGGSGSNFLKFPVVKSVLTLLTLISQYVELSSQLPALTLDTLNRLLELLTLFNSRTCGLVLGAGAMHMAGLRSITATHLALSSQAIALVSSQMDGLQRLFASRLSVKQHVFLLAFDRVKHDFDEHALQVREKLIGIMRDLIESMMRKLQQQLSLNDRERREAAGEQEEEEEDDVVSPAVRLLMKQTCSLHRALTDLLSVRERNIIFQQIGASLVAGFVQVSRRVEAETAAAAGGKGAERARVMLQGNGLHIMMRMRTLTGVDDNVMLQLREFVEQLKVEQQQQQQHAHCSRMSLL